MQRAVRFEPGTGAVVLHAEGVPVPSIEVGAVSQIEESTTRKDPAVRVGYWLAVFFPMVGVLVGTSLISRNSDKGPRIVVISVISIVVWISLLVVLDEISPGLIET